MNTPSKQTGLLFRAFSAITDPNAGPLPILVIGVLGGVGLVASIFAFAAVVSIIAK